jgi:hypothetical protein
VEDFSLKIILPEGSVIGKVSTPYPMKREADTKHYTYLDTSGRCQCYKTFFFAVDDKAK